MPVPATVSAPDRHCQHAHVAARAAGHRRRRRPERLRASGGQAARRRRRRGRHLHPRGCRAPPPAGRAAPRRPGPARAAACSRTWPRTSCRPLCHFTFDVLRAEAGPTRAVRPAARALLAVRAGRGRCARPADVPLVQSMHTLGKVKNAALAAGDARAAGADARRGPRSSPRADRLIANTDDEARQLITTTAATPVADHDPGGTRSAVHPGRRGPARQRTRPARATAWCWSSPAGCSRSRRPTSCCTPRPG